MHELIRALEKLLDFNFGIWWYKYTYLYNELFISVFKNNDFVLIWVTYKFDKLNINNYRNSFRENGKLLQVLIKKFEKIIIKLLQELNKQLNKIWEETDFINIYDKKELEYEDIKNILSFSFLDDYSYRRIIQNDFYFEDLKILDIYHSDFECSKCSWPKETFTNFPDFNKTIDEKFFPINKKNKRDFLFTNITEYESIVIWWNEKINEILQDKKLINKYDLISLNKTCISVIMWDDIGSIFKYNKINPKKIFYTDQSIDSPYRTVINYFKNIDFKESKNNQELLFFWLIKNKNTYDLVRFIEDNFGIKVWNILLPSISVSDLNNILNYKLLVFFDSRVAKSQNIFKLYPLDNIQTSIPYSTKQLREFFYSILKEYNKQEQISIFDKLNLEYREKYKKLYDIAAVNQIWFIVQAHNLKYFIEDNLRWVPILWMLKDMWFKVKFFVYSNNDKYYNLINDFKSLSYEIIVSKDKKELKKFLKDKDIKLYYSEISNDKRILSHNKQQFSIWDLEYSLDWFYKTLGLLIKKCQMVDYMQTI